MLMQRGFLSGLSLQLNSKALPPVLELQQSLSTSCRSLFAAKEETVAVNEQEEGASTSGRSLSSVGSVNWDWKWVLGKVPGRKPAIKRPSRHQWVYCNPNYDSSKPLPVTARSPFAPPEETLVSDSATMQWHLKQQPLNRQDKHYQRKYTRFAHLRELDWREAFQRGVAEDMRAAKKRERLEAEEQRQRSWQEYKERLFETARLEGERAR